MEIGGRKDHYHRFAKVTSELTLPCDSVGSYVGHALGSSQDQFKAPLSCLVTGEEKKKKKDAKAVILWSSLVKLNTAEASLAMAAC